MWLSQYLRCLFVCFGDKGLENQTIGLMSLKSAQLQALLFASELLKYFLVTGIPFFDRCFNTYISSALDKIKFAFFESCVCEHGMA